MTVDDIIAANGERIPAYENSPHNFSAKFVIVGEKDVSIGNDALKSVHEAKRLLEQYWASSTRGLSSLTIE